MTTLIDDLSKLFNMSNIDEFGFITKKPLTQN